VNFVIEEKDKVNVVQVGQKLKIKDRKGEYDELDEIVVSHSFLSITNDGIYIRFILYCVLTTHL
jgi:hypothetical protein